MHKETYVSNNPLTFFFRILKEKKIILMFVIMLLKILSDVYFNKNNIYYIFSFLLINLKSK